MTLASKLISLQINLKEKVDATAVQPSTYGRMHVGDLYGAQEATIALGYASSNSRASFVLRIQNSEFSRVHLRPCSVVKKL